MDFVSPLSPFSASVLPSLSDKRKLEGGRKMKPRERILSGVPAPVRRQAVLSLPASLMMEPALIVVNADDSPATAPRGQILARMIDRPWSGSADDV